MPAHEEDDWLPEGGDPTSTRGHFRNNILALPLSLVDIDARLQAGYYRTEASFESDCDLLAQNQKLICGHGMVESAAAAAAVATFLKECTRRDVDTDELQASRPLRTLLAANRCGGTQLMRTSNLGTLSTKGPYKRICDAQAVLEVNELLVTMKDKMMTYTSVWVSQEMMDEHMATLTSEMSQRNANRRPPAPR